MWLFTNLATVGFVVLVILFQTEIRGVLAQIGHSRVVRFFYRSEESVSVDEITRAAMRLERGAEVPRKPSRFIEELSAPDLHVYEIAREERLSGADVQSMADAFLARLNAGPST